MSARVVLAVGLLVVLGVLALEMSKAAPRTAGSDHISPSVFAAQVPGGGRLCQPVPPLPADAHRAQLLLGGYGHPLPSLRLDFIEGPSHVIASGQLAAGAREGTVTVPIRQLGTSSQSLTMCLTVGHTSRIAVAGEAVPGGPAAETVNGRQQPGRISVLYLRTGKDSWFALFSTLVDRFGVGKASFFGTWTLPLLIAVMVGLWASALGLLVRELK